MGISDKSSGSIGTYVRKGTTLLNTAFLIMHICFSFFFNRYDIDIMTYFNNGSIALYIICYYLLYKGWDSFYIVFANLEVYLFMILAIICLGWNYGFQQYCFVFVASLLFTDYYSNNKHKLSKITAALIFVVVFTFVALRIATYYHDHIYVVPVVLSERAFYTVNSMIAFIFLIVYFYFYSQTVMRLEKQLIDVAQKDALTGLCNRRRMQEIFENVLEHHSEANDHICIGMIDIDSFKNINDTYGHDAGDEVIRTLARALLDKHSENKNFQPCRWGGEEFLILYQRYDLTKEEVIREFDALRQKIADTAVMHNGTEIHFTITLGLSFYNNHASISEMIKHADTNLYHGKANGKNVVIYHPKIFTEK